MAIWRRSKFGTITDSISSSISSSKSSGKGTNTTIIGWTDTGYQNKEINKNNNLNNKQQQQQPCRRRQWPRWVTIKDDSKNKKQSFKNLWCSVFSLAWKRRNRIALTLINIRRHNHAFQKIISARGKKKGSAQSGFSDPNQINSFIIWSSNQKTKWIHLFLLTSDNKSLSFSLLVSLSSSTTHSYFTELPIPIDPQVGLGTH